MMQGRGGIHEVEGDQALLVRVQHGLSPDCRSERGYLAATSEPDVLVETIHIGVGEASGRTRIQSRETYCRTDLHPIGFGRPSVRPRSLSASSVRSGNCKVPSRNACARFPGPRTFASVRLHRDEAIVARRVRGEPRGAIAGVSRPVPRPSARIRRTSRQARRLAIAQRACPQSSADTADTARKTACSTSDRTGIRRISRRSSNRPL